VILAANPFSLSPHSTTTLAAPTSITECSIAVTLQRLNSRASLISASAAVVRPATVTWVATPRASVHFSAPVWVRDNCFRQGFVRGKLQRKGSFHLCFVWCYYDSSYWCWFEFHFVMCFFWMRWGFGGLSILRFERPVFGG